MSDTLRSRTIRLASSLPQGSPTRKALARLLTRTSNLQDGPVGEVLDSYWNSIHDFENELGKAARPYDNAASYMGGAAEKDARAMVKLIEKTQKALDDLATDTFHHLVDAESEFLKKHGDPDAYSNGQSEKMFSR